MRELWHVVAAKDDQTPLYSVALSVDTDDVTVSGPAAAIQVACDRLLVAGYDPRQVTIWHLARRDAPQPEVAHG